MPRSIQIAVPAELADALAADLRGIDGVIGLVRLRAGRATCWAGAADELYRVTLHRRRPLA